MHRFFILLILTIFLVGCSSNQSNDFTSLKQRALEIPPDFELTPPGEGEELDIESPESIKNEISDVETLILDSSGSSEIVKTNDEEVETGSLEEFIEDQF
jgi:PBP1b-binding outer membrane lipoprotein LpoB